MGILTSTIRLLAGIKYALNKLENTITTYQESQDRKEKDKTQTEFKAIVSLPVEVTSYYESEQSERLAKSRRESFRTRLEVVGVLAAIILAVFTFCTLITMNGQLKAMQQQTCIQKEASINAERAWLGLVGMPEVDSSSLEQARFTAPIKLTVKNFGKGPALNVTATSQLATHGRVNDALMASCALMFPYVGLKTTPPVFSTLDFSKVQAGDLLFPDQQMIRSISWVGDSSSIVGQEVFVVGCIVYKDQFGNPHWTKFSYDTDPLTAVRNASSFRHLYITDANNYTDDAEKKSACPN